MNPNLKTFGFSAADEIPGIKIRQEKRMIDKRICFLMVPLLGQDAVSKITPALKKIFKKKEEF
jgi:hypothetical protein